MTLRHMKIFITVCECDSVTAAAKKLYLAQPAVSLVISQLEEYYGVKLFDRISRRLYITPVGKQVLGYAKHIVNLFDEMENNIRNWEEIGTIRIGSSITIGNKLLPTLVHDFKKQFPKLEIQIVIDNSEKIESRVLSNEIDFGLIEGMIHNDHIHFEKFMDDRLVVICDPTHALATKDEVDLQTLVQYDFILREKGSGGRELFDSMVLVNNLEVHAIWESIDTQAIIESVKSGIGLSVLPYLLVKQDLLEGSIKEIKVKNITFDRPFYIIYHKNKFFTETVKVFINLCRNLS